MRYTNEELNSHLGIWIYIMSDCILFATLFSVYVILHNNMFNGKCAQEMINIPVVFFETLALLASSFTYSAAMCSYAIKKKRRTIILLFITFLLGLIFITMEQYEFYVLYKNHYSWSENAALSSFFTLIGTHSLHVIIGLFWIIINILQLSLYSFSKKTKIKLSCLGLFWHFLDIIWIIVYSTVYLIGKI
jgi:cytochrome o ubiquinol oxidase subunit 3